MPWGAGRAPERSQVRLRRPGRWALEGAPLGAERVAMIRRRSGARHSLPDGTPPPNRLGSLRAAPGCYFHTSPSPAGTLGTLCVGLVCAVAGRGGGCSDGPAAIHGDRLHQRRHGQAGGEVGGWGARVGPDAPGLPDVPDAAWRASTGTHGVESTSGHPGPDPAAGGDGAPGRGHGRAALGPRATRAVSGQIFPPCGMPMPTAGPQAARAAATCFHPGQHGLARFASLVLRLGSF